MSSFVQQGTTIADLKEHVTSQGFSVRDISLLSKEGSTFLSFKLSVPMSEFKSLFNEDL